MHPVAFSKIAVDVPPGWYYPQLEYLFEDEDILQFLVNL